MFALCLFSFQNAFYNPDRWWLKIVFWAVKSGLTAGFMQICLVFDLFADFIMDDVVAASWGKLIILCSWCSSNLVIRKHLRGLYDNWSLILQNNLSLRLVEADLIQMFGAAISLHRMRSSISQAIFDMMLSLCIAVASYHMIRLMDSRRLYNLWGLFEKHMLAWVVVTIHDLFLKNYYIPSIPSLTV